MSKAGNIEISLDKGGYPVWCSVRYNHWNGELSEFRISHTELSDLKYAAEKAMQQARSILPEGRKDEV